MNQNNSVYTNKDNRLQIVDSEQFIRMLGSGGSDRNEYDTLEHYEVMKQYGVKQLNTMAGDIPYEDYPFIINFAIAKTVKDFNPEFKTNLLSFFWDKLRGEVSSYRTKRDNLQNKVMKSINNTDGVEYIYQKDKGSDSNTIIQVSEESMEDKIVKIDLYKRQMKALKMAFSGIPRELQFVLNEVGNGKKIREIAEILGVTNFEVSKKRNQGLSLILQRVMRSKHLMEDEKMSLAELHDIYLEDSVEFQENL